MNAMKVEVVKQMLVAAMDNGGLGVVAARTSTSEGELRNWIDGVGHTPSEAALSKLHALACDLVEDKGADPYNREGMRA